MFDEFQADRGEVAIYFLASHISSGKAVLSEDRSERSREPGVALDSGKVASEVVCSMHGVYSSSERPSIIEKCSRLGRLRATSLKMCKMDHNVMVGTRRIEPRQTGRCALPARLPCRLGSILTFGLVNSLRHSSHSHPCDFGVSPT